MNTFAAATKFATRVRLNEYVTTDPEVYDLYGYPKIVVNGTKVHNVLRQSTKRFTEEDIAHAIEVLEERVEANYLFVN